MDLGIRNRVALVTGASAGLGFAAAKALAAEGARIAIVSRSAENLAAAVLRLRQETGAEAVTFVADVSRLETIGPLVRQVRERLGPIDILVANAGGPPPGTLADLPTQAFEGAWRLTLMSAVELCREVLPDMKTSGWGRIVAITSITVKQPVETLLLSNIFRTGLTAFLKTLSKEVAPGGITVNSVAPGYTDTERLVELARDNAARQNRTVEEIRAGWANDTPMKRLGRPEEIGAVVAWLCSAQASFMTGNVISVDGGRATGLF